MDETRPPAADAPRQAAAASSSRSGTWALGLGMCSFLILCAIVVSLYDVWRAERALAWPTADGVVVESTYAGGCGRRGTGYHTVVRYTYEAGGVARESRRILFGAASCDSLETAKAMTGDFPAAARVSVRFDPQSPAQSVLIAGKVDDSTWGAISIMSLWLVLTSAATGMLVIVARTERRPGPGLPKQRPLGKGP